MKEAERAKDGGSRNEVKRMERAVSIEVEQTW